MRLLPEPTAAAISFGAEQMEPGEAKTIMVFDLGGGTFDISILSICDGCFMKVTKGGDGFRQPERPRRFTAHRFDVAAYSLVRTQSH